MTNSESQSTPLKNNNEREYIRSVSEVWRWLSYKETLERVRPTSARWPRRGEEELPGYSRRKGSGLL